MIKLTLFDPLLCEVVVFLSPYVLAPGRAFLTADEGEVGLTFHSAADLRAFVDRLSAAAALALDGA